MNIFRRSILFLLIFALIDPVYASMAGTAIRETAEFILKKFGRGTSGQTVEEISEATAKVIAKHGNDALPLLRGTGHAGFAAFREAGENAPDVLRLYLQKGDEAIWIISQPEKLKIFLLHGDPAANALLKHPGVADSLIGKYGDAVIEPLNTLSRQNAQRLNMVADDVSIPTTKLLPIIQQYGDTAMNFIWKHKASLAVASVFLTFTANPNAYITGMKDLVTPITSSINWTLILAGTLIVLFLPFIADSIIKAKRKIQERHTIPKN